ncbi:MAG: VWA domain-containing protein [Deltaproteobacteria bacterium]|nr:VWA domain-containing protein [Deltaproteobacteria bacterium]
MTFLGPISITTFLWIAGGASALVISAYIIKMRRRRFEVPFAQLWRRVLEQKDANALWKQLKRLMSLLLILFILGMVLFAALDPTVGAVNRSARSVVVLIDASASMKAMDGNKAGNKSRIEAAKERADELIDSMGGGDVAMVMKVDGQATPLSRFSSDAPMLHNIVHGSDTVTADPNARPATAAAGDQARAARDAEIAKRGGTLGGIVASDTPADLTRALGAAADALRDRPNPLIVLISDGAFPEAQLGLVSWAPQVDRGLGLGTGSGSAGPKIVKDLASVDLTNIDVRYLPVGERSDNVGIVSFNVRRYIANKAAYEVYIEVQNFGQEPASRDLALYNGDTAVDIKRLVLKPGERIKKIYEKLPASTLFLSSRSGPIVARSWFSSVAGSFS